MTDISQPTADPNAAKMDSAIAGVEGAIGNEAKTFEQQQSALAPRYSALQKTLDQPLPTPPQQQRVAPAPKPEDFQKYSMAFAGAMAVLGAVAGRYTRMTGQLALNSFTGALKGWQEGNLEAYQQHAKEWEQNTKATIENNNQVLGEYKQALENRRLNIDQQMSQIQLIAAQYHDKMMFDAATAKNYTMVAQLYSKQQQYTEKVKEAADTLILKRDQGLAKLKNNPNYWNTPAGIAEYNRSNDEEKAGIDKIRGGGSGGGQMSEQQIEYQAQQYNLVGSKALAGLPYRSPDRAKIVQRAADLAIAEGQSGGDTVAKRADVGAATSTLTKLTQQRAAINQFEQTAIKNGDVLVKLADKVDRTGVPVVERWLRAGRKSVDGDPDVSTFNAQISLYRNEVAKIITNPNLTGVLSDHARAEAEQFLGGADSAKQIRAVTELLKGDMGRRSQSLDAEIDRTKAQISGKSSPQTPANNGGWTVKRID